MKKFVLGCLGVLVLLAIAGGVAGYYFVYRPIKGYATSLAQFKEIPDIEKQITNTSTFTPPDNGELTPALVDRYVKVQQTIEARMGARLNELDVKYKALSKANNDQPSFTEAMGALRDLAGLIVEAKHVQVDAMNAQGFSKDEYSWTRRTVYSALGVEITAGVAEAIQKASRGDTSASDDTSPAPTVGAVPERNRELVEPYRKMLEKNAGIAFFGL